MAQSYYFVTLENIWSISADGVIFGKFVITHSRKAKIELGASIIVESTMVPVFTFTPFSWRYSPIKANSRSPRFYASSR